MPRVEVIGRSDEAGRPLIQDVSEAELSARPDLYRPLATGPVLAQGAGGELFATTRAGLAQDVTGARAAGTDAVAAEAARRGDEAIYGTLKQQALTGLEGLADSASLGLYTASRLAGARPDNEAAEDIRGRARVNPGIRAATKVAGDVGLALLSGGTSQAGKLARLTGPGALARGSAKVTERAATRGVGAQLLAGTATGAGEGAIAALGDTLAESALQDAPLSGEALLANMGKGALIGSVAGGVAETVSVGGRKLLGQLERARSAGTPDDLARAVEDIDEGVIETGGAAVQDAATSTIETRATRLVTPEQLETERMSAAGRVVQAVEQSAGGLRQAKAQIRQVVGQIPPEQALQMQAALEAHQRAVIEARKAGRAAAQAVAAGKNPPDGALEVLARVDSTRASLDDAIGTSYDAAGLPRPEPVMLPIKPKATPEPAQPDAAPPQATEAPASAPVTEAPSSATAPAREPVSEPSASLGAVDATAPAADNVTGLAKSIEIEGKTWELDESGDWIDPATGEIAEGKTWGAINERTVDDLLARDISPSMPPERLREVLEQELAAHKAIRSAVDYASSKAPTVTISGQVLATQRRHAVAVAEALERLDGAPDDVAAALQEVQDARRLLREDLTAARGQGKVAGTLRDEQAREIVQQWRRSVVEDGQRIDLDTGEVLEGPQWEQLGKAIERLERSPSLDADAIDSYAVSNAKRIFADVREAFQKQDGADFYEVMLPRNTSAYNRTLLTSEQVARIDAEYARRFARSTESLTAQGDRWVDKVRRAKAIKESEGKAMAVVDELERMDAPAKSDAQLDGEIKAAAVEADLADMKATASAEAAAPAAATASPRAAPSPAPSVPAASTATAGGTSAAPVSSAPAAPASPLDAVSLPDAPEVKASGARGVAERVADAAGYLEIAQSLGVPGLPDVDSIPVIGPVLGAYLKARAILGGGRLGRVIGTKGTVKAAENVVKVRSVIDKAVRGLAKGMASPTTKALIKSGIRVTGKALDNERAKQEMAEVRELAGDRDRIAARIEARLAGAPQPVIDATVDAAERKAKWLASKAPRPALADTPFAPEWSPSPVQVRDWEIRTGVVDAPQDAISGLLSGRYNAVAVDALRNVYPELYADVQRQLLARIDDIVQRVPRPLRLNIGKAFDLPLDSTQVAWYAAAMATAGQDQQQQQEQPAGPPPSAAVVPRYTSTLATGPEARAMRGR